MDRGYGKKRDTHPKDDANFFSLASFAYMFKLIQKGRIKEIDENDLSNVLNRLESKKLGDQLEECWERCREKNLRVSIIRPLLYCHGLFLFILWVAHLIVAVITTYTSPWALGKFVSYFESGQTSISKHEALLCAVVLAAVHTLHGLWRQHYGLWKTELGIKLQCSVSSLLYRKSLTLSQAQLKGITTGNIVTGITKDVETINTALIFGMDNAVEVVQIVFVSILLYQKVGVASLGGIAIVFISLFSQIGFARFTYRRRGACNEKSDQRLKQTKEILSSIRLIKMYGWESFFEKRLLFLRKIELKNLYMVFIIKSLARIVGSVSEKTAHILTLLVYLWIGKRLNADTVYYTTKLFQRIARAMVFIPMGIQSLSEFLVALARINKILRAEENQAISKGCIQTIKPEINFVEAHVQIDELKILNNLNLKLKIGLNVIVGPSGCGKSSLLKTILEEYSTTSGKMRIQGNISYAAQNPWLFPSSLKQNILFGEPLNEYKYTKILSLCGLTYDINTFSVGDEVVLTDCGANLSRGQQARINLARAIYRDSDIYLLDDCLSSLDIHIKNHVFDNAIKSYLSTKVCLLVTHSSQFVNQADNVIIMEEGTVRFSGKPCDIPSEILHHKEDKNGVNQDKPESNNEKEKEIEDESTDESSTLLSKSQNKDKDNIYHEVKKAGKVDFEVYKSYVKYGGGLVMLATIVSLHIICEVSTGLGDKFLSKWLNAQKAVPTNISTWSNLMKLNSTTGQIPQNTSEMPTESFTNAPFSFDSLKPENFSISKIYNVTVLNYKNNMDYFDYFIGATLFATVFTFIVAFVNFYFAMKISRNVHKSMISNLLQSCMSFFDTHLIGNVLTRFSRDMFIMDEFIPYLWHWFKMVFVLAVNFTLIATVNPMFAGLSICNAVIFYLIADYLLSTTRNLQRLSSSTLSPMIGHLNTTLDGLCTIRAHGTQQILRDEFDKHQNLFFTAHHLKEITIRLMGFYCHAIGSIFTTFVTIRLLFIQGVLAGDAGLVMTQANMLSHHIEIVLMLWMIMENNMTSVERLLEYTKLQEENNTGRNLENWPNKGEIKFQNVSLTYRTNGETVLKNLNFTAHPQEKIGIVGRTGAGKSSIIVSMFKMYDYAGDITIDNVDIKTLSLECLRTHLAIIPQDPIIFSGTVRTNIDPFETITDEEVWRILDVVNLKSHFKNLDEDINGKNLSIGQKQLISIARALTKKTKIVILDEATANMDEKMDELIHKKIMELFKFCTVITVAHRLNTVMNHDKILVMDQGEIVEFDTPQNLLSNTKGIFYRMVNQNNVNEGSQHNRTNIT